MRKQKMIRQALAAALAVVLLAAYIPKTYAVSSGEIREQIDALESQQEQLRQEYEVLQGQYQENEDEILDIVSQKNVIDQEISLLNQQIDLTNDQIAAYSLLIADKQDELDAANARLETLRTEHRARVRAMEEDGELSYWSVIFGANSFSDLLAKLTMIQEIAEADQRRLAALDDAAAQVAQAQTALEMEKAALEETRVQLEASQVLLREKRQEADRILRDLSEKEQEFQQMLDASEALQDQLMQEVAQLEDAYDEAKHKEWKETSIPEPDEPSDPGDDTREPSASGWLCPLTSYVLTSPFGMRLHPTLGIYRMHNGIDMAAPAMTPIYAARSGLVTRATYQDQGAGYYVSLSHGDGFGSIYMHMTYFVVAEGDYVEQGQIIGYVGNSGGISTGNHLHFGISYNGEYVNPVPYIS